MVLVTPKQEVERKSEWFWGVNFFRSNPKVEWENGNRNSISRWGFFVHMRQFNFYFYCFFNFLIGFFFKMVFPIHSLFILGLVFCLVNESSLNCTSGIVLLCFLICRLHRRFLRPGFSKLTFSMNSVTSTPLHLKFVCLTPFQLLGQLRDLPHS